MKTLQVMAGVFALWTGLLMAAETVTDQTQFQLRTQTGAMESVTIDDLAVGETRTVRAESGTAVVIGRHEEGYVLDVNGERFEVDVPQVQTLINGDASVISTPEGARRIVVKTDDKKAEDGSTSTRKIVMISTGDEAVPSDVDAEAALTLADALTGELPEGKRIRVIRKIRRHE